MKLLLYSHFFPPSVGGTATIVLALGLAGYAPAGNERLPNGGVDALVLRNPQDANELAAALQCLLADSSLCATIGANASQTAALFSWDRHAGEIHRLLSDATAHRA
jgi:glycosyltransferase involved in cell wall biosynthesis